MTNINDIADLAQVLQDNPQWRDIIRGILLGDELLEIPRRVAALVSVTEMVVQRLERIESDVEGLKEGQVRLEGWKPARPGWKPARPTCPAGSATSSAPTTNGGRPSQPGDWSG